MAKTQLTARIDPQLNREIEEIFSDVNNGYNTKTEVIEELLNEGVFIVKKRVSGIGEG